MKIMIVERDAINALSITNELSLAGHCVLASVSSLAAAIVMADSEHPDFALIDIDLDQKNEGIKIAALLKEKGIVSLFLTAQVDQARANPNDAVGVMAKPFHPEDIVAVLVVLMEVLNGRSPPPPPIPAAMELFKRH